MTFFGGTLESVSVRKAYFEAKEMIISFPEDVGLLGFMAYQPL